MRDDISSEEIQIYLEEFGDQIQNFEDGLLKLEKDSENTELISKIFRSAHTLKGSSYAIGLDNIGEFTHSLENLLNKLRSKELKLTPDITNILLEGLDILKVAKSDLEQGKEEQDFGSFINKVNQVYEGRGKEEDIFISKDEIEKITKENSNFNIYKIFIRTSPKPDEIALRISQIFSYLSETGKIYKSKPTSEEVENEKVGEEVNAIFLSEKKKEEIKEILNLVADVEKIDIEVLVEKKQDEVKIIPRAEIKEKEINEQKKGKPPVQKEPSPAPSVVGRSIRIDIERLDTLMNLLGELVIDRTRLIQLGSNLESKYEDDSTVISINQTFEHLDKITTELHQQIMKTRLLPLEILFNKFPRVVRDLSLKSGKKINFKIEGEKTELDREIIEQIGDPLIHILRNSVDHGIEDPSERKRKGKPEEGTIILSARQQEDHILITIEDDGKGIDINRIKEKSLTSGVISKSSLEQLTDKEILNFIFISGFSTKESASEVSGRGVGMDIVKSNIEKLNGSVILETEKDKGTKMIIKLPLTLAIVDSLLVGVGENIFAFPLFSVVEALVIQKEDIRTIRRNETINLRGEVLPILSLKEIFELGEIREDEENYLWIVVIGWADRKAGFIVDSLAGSQEIVIKPLSPLIEKVEGISGVAILGSGDVVLILDIPGLIKFIIEEKVKSLV